MDLVANIHVLSPSFLLRDLTTRVVLHLMASVGSVTRQIAALEISAKQNGATRPPPTTSHLKKGSHSSQNVQKMLAKFAQPNPFPPGIQKATSTSSLASKSTRPASPTKTAPTPTPAPASATTTAPTPAATQQAAPKKVDIGRYDGGFEIDNETRGEKVHGEAAEHLALDSSVAR